MADLTDDKRPSRRERKALRLEQKAARTAARANALRGEDDPGARAAPPSGESPFREDESAEPARKGFRLDHYAGQVLSGNILTRAEVRRYYPYIFFMALLMLLYIANGYHIQTLHRRYDRLNDQVKELRSRSLTLSSIRMSATRQSEIVREVERRGIPLHESLEPPKVIEK